MIDYSYLNNLILGGPHARQHERFRWAR